MSCGTTASANLRNHDTGGFEMSRDDERGVCRFCGRDNEGHENEPCSDDCPSEVQ